jgi:protein-tyrosine phosphatase
MRDVKTSVSHPIRGDWISQELPGKIGLTFAPGKHAYARYEGGQWERDLDADLDRLIHTYGMRVQVCLLEDHELAALRIPTLVHAASAHGIEVLRLPIPDGSVPPQLALVTGLLDDILAAARAGKNVVIHCQGGLGRAGTIGGCLLVRLGKSSEDALAILRDARDPMCPETEEQREFIRRFSGHAPGGKGQGIRGS